MWCFDINNENDFHKKEISATRVEHSQTFVPLSKGKVFYGQEPPSGESTTTDCEFKIATTCSSLLKLPNGELLVAVDHNQLRTMASETVDPIDWSHRPPYTGQYPVSSTYCTVQCGLQITRLAALSEQRTCDLQNARPTHCLCCHSGYSDIGQCTVSTLELNIFCFYGN